MSATASGAAPGISSARTRSALALRRAGSDARRWGLRESARCALSLFRLYLCARLGVFVRALIVRCAAAWRAIRGCVPCHSQLPPTHFPPPSLLLHPLTHRPSIATSASSFSRRRPRPLCTCDDGVESSAGGIARPTTSA